MFSTGSPLQIICRSKACSVNCGAAHRGSFCAGFYSRALLSTCCLSLVRADPLQELVLNLKAQNKQQILISADNTADVFKSWLVDNGFNHGLVFACSCASWVNNQVKQLRRRKAVVVGTQPQSKTMKRLVPAPNYLRVIIRSNYRCG